MRHPGESGLTLVETLVVLAIIAVMGSIAVLGLGGADRSATAQAEAQRLAASIQMAADEALILDRPAGLVIDGNGYAFALWDGASGTWADHPRPDLGQRHDFADGLTLSSDIRASPLPLGEGAGPYHLTVTSGGQSWRVMFDGLNATAAPGASG